MHCLLSLSLLTGLALAQAVASGQGAPLPIGQGRALDVVDGTLTAIGDDYKATFVDGELVFTPLLGLAAPRNLPMALVVTHTGRGPLAPVGAAATQHGDCVATFVRPELQERFEVRAEGLKQSFVFTQLPPGDGDLVVRSRLRTELRPDAAVSDGSLRFTFGEVGGVEVGQVLGIDADGRHMTGTLRCDGEHLDVVLPAAFVREAKLPLVVDPLLSPLVLTTSTLPDSLPDVAHLAAPADAYLVTWVRAVSATDNDVRGQRVSGAGALLGGLIMIETTAASVVEATVAASEIAQAWMVAWEVAGDIKSRFLSSTGVLLTTTDVANGANLQRSPTLAGGGLAGGPFVVCIWNDATTNQILSRRFNLLTQTGSFPAATIASGTSLITVSDPTLSRDNRFDSLLAVWTSTNLVGLRTLRSIVIDDLGVPRSPAVSIGGGGGAEAFAATCAGNGDDFVVAFRTASTVTGNGAACVPVQFTFGGAALGPLTAGAPRSITGPNGAVRTVAAAMFQGSATVAFSSVGAIDHDVRALSVDPFACTDCEGSLAVDVGGNDTGIAICSRAFTITQTSPNEGAVVFVPIVGGQGDVTLRLLRAADGVRVELDINCTSGQVFAPCARAGNANFGVVLRGAAANELTLVIHSLGLLNFNCNPCLIGPDPSLGVVQFLGATSATGGIRSPLPLPGGAGVVGATIHSQFVLFGGQCFGSFRVTEGISCTLQ